MKYFYPKKIYIEKEALEDTFTQALLKRVPDIAYEVIESSEPLIHTFNQNENPFNLGKQYLLLKRTQGKTFKPFPLIPEYLSCHFQVLHLGSGCDLECTYCFLQSYLNNPIITLYTNIEEILAGLKAYLDEKPDHFYRITTGELIDSLSLNHIADWTQWLIPFFAKQENALLELKTKSNNIDALKDLDHRQRTTVSWSMNAKSIQEKEELKCASLRERILAAKQCQEWGYSVGFHLDPLIYFPNWKKEYKETIDLIFDHVDASKITWISFGSLRYAPHLKKIAEKRFKKTALYTGEFIRGLDGKQRYFKPIRQEMYQQIFSWIRERTEKTPLYLCMEDSELWNSSLKQKMPDSEKLSDYLDGLAKQSCQIL